MMPILVKSDDVRSGRKAKAHLGWLWEAQESMGLSQTKALNKHNKHDEKMNENLIQTHATSTKSGNCV